jgi:DNA-binding IclR family transcriptional regulator
MHTPTAQNYTSQEIPPHTGTLRQYTHLAAALARHRGWAAQSKQTKELTAAVSAADWHQDSEVFTAEGDKMSVIALKQVS